MVWVLYGWIKQALAEDTKSPSPLANQAENGTKVQQTSSAQNAGKNKQAAGSIPVEGSHNAANLSPEPGSAGSSSGPPPGPDKK